MKNIIVITDGLSCNTVKKSIKPGVNVLLYLEFSKYLELNEDEILHEKELFIEQMLYILKRDSVNVDYIFSFIERRGHAKKAELADWILNVLKVLEVPEEKIIDANRIYRSLFPREEYVRKITNPQLQQLDGVVLGMSHALTGILAELLPIYSGSVCNFANSSQDIGFNYYIAQQIWSGYYEKVKDVKYVVIDMFDYTYFNFETMCTGATLDYFQVSGIECPKEYDAIRNKNLNMNSDAINSYLKTKWPHSKVEERLLLTECFENLIENDENAYCAHYTVADGICELTVDDIERYISRPTVSSVQTSIFEQSIQKNVRKFYELLNFIHKNNPSAKIILCLIPKYKAVEDFEGNAFEDWKAFFEKTLSDLQKKIPFVYWDFKTDEEISGRKEYYQDMTHLNMDGAYAFSKKLAKKISDELACH